MFNISDEVAEVCGDPTLCEVQSGNGNVGLAFGLTIGAGLATTLGAMLPFVPFIKRTNTIFLSAGLALAAGVMLYVSFTEILTKSQDNFCCVTTQHYGLAVTACFFGGIIFTVLLDLITAGLQKLECGCKPCRNRHSLSLVQIRTGIPKIFFRSRRDPNTVHTTNMVELKENGIHKTSLEVPILDSVVELNRYGNGEFLSNNVNDGSSRHTNPSHEVKYDQQGSECDSQVCGGSSVLDGASISIASGNPSEGTNRCANASVNELFSNTSLLRMNAIIPETASLSLAGVEEDCIGEAESQEVVSVNIENGSADVNQEKVQTEGTEEEEAEALGPVEFKEVANVLEKDTKQLHRMGLLTAFAIALHNFPEGMATFVAALSSPTLGVALAIAIALHNVPEGLCVAMPVYYATGSRVKGFLWAFLSGVSEPIGALLGWLILKDIFGPVVFGIAFGLISGMMVFISLKELLPTAYKFDKTHGRLVAFFLGLGMLVMALSLVLFLY